MKLNFQRWWSWARHRPTVLINLVGLAIIILGGAGYLIYQSNRSIQVLQDWKIAIVPSDTREINGKTVGVYNPGDSLVFTSKTTKLIDAKGTTVRMIVCDATATQAEREIQLDSIPATRPVGVSPKRENAIVVPDVSQFAGLPRWCRLVIDITYENVALGRDRTEHAETVKFLVEEEELDPSAIRRQISELNEKVKALEAQLQATGSPVIPSNGAVPTQPTPSTVPAPGSSSPTTQQRSSASTVPVPAPQENTQTHEDNRSELSRLPLVGGVFEALGL